MLRKQCVQQNSVLDFLTEIVSKVPDIGTDPNQEERNGSARRRKVSDGDNDDSDEEDVKRPRAIRTLRALHLGPNWVSAILFEAVFCLASVPTFHGIFHSVSIMEKHPPARTCNGSISR
ncbi:unnamed protein product [Calypogeia fissa]